MSYAWQARWLKVLSNNNVNISDMLEVSCGSNVDNKWIKIWDDSYIYDDDCWWGSTTLHIDSDDAVAITSNSYYGIYINTNWKVWIGGSSIPIYGLDVISTGRFQKDLYIQWKVGIWTSSPSVALEVNGAAIAKKITAGDGATLNTDWDIQTYNGKFNTYLGKYKNETNGNTYNYGLLISDTAWEIAQIGMRIIMSQINHIAATFWGRVGIWLDNPAELLDVEGTGQFNDIRVTNWIFKLITPSNPTYNNSSSNCTATWQQYYLGDSPSSSPTIASRDTIYLIMNHGNSYNFFLNYKNSAWVSIAGIWRTDWGIHPITVYLPKWLWVGVLCGWVWPGFNYLKITSN